MLNTVFKFFKLPSKYVHLPTKTSTRRQITTSLISKFLFLDLSIFSLIKIYSIFRSSESLREIRREIETYRGAVDTVNLKAKELEGRMDRQTTTRKQNIQQKVGKDK